MIDQQGTVSETEEFSEEALGHLNGAFLSFMVSLGHRSGLFDTMHCMSVSPAQDGAGLGTVLSIAP